MFQWVFFRFLTVFTTVSTFAFFGMLIVSVLRNEMPLYEILLTYFSPALLLSTLSVLLGICFSQEHIATMVCGVIWLAAMLTRALLRIPGMEYSYLFIRYAGDQNGIWLWNKIVLIVISLLIWGVIYMVCKK